MDNKTAFYISAGIGAMGLIAAFATGGGLIGLIGFILSAIGVAFAMAFYKYGYVIIPMLTSSAKKILVTTDGYELTPAQDILIKKTKDGKYYATMFLTLKLYQSAVEMSGEQLRVYNKMFESAMASFKGVIKIGFVLHAVDISTKKRELETKKAEAQLRLQREREKTEPDPLRVERYEREVMYWNSQIDKLSRGLRPMRVVLYTMVTDVGLTKDEAIARVKNQASEAKTLLSNSLNCEVFLLVGDELLKMFDWEHFLPATPEELEERAELERSNASSI